MGKMTFPEIDLDGIKGVLLDIDNTLYIYEPVHQKALSACYSTLPFTMPFDRFSIAYRDKRDEVIERLRPQGVCRSRLLAFQALFEEMSVEQAFNKAWELETVYWDTFIDNMELCPEAEKLLYDCRREGIKVCAVSDMQTHFQIRKLKALGVDTSIDYLVTSEEVGREKPAGIIFKTALKKLGLKPQEVVMIGDNEEKDIEGAQAAGIKGFLVTC